MRSFDQERLGTDIGKAPKKKTIPFCAGYSWNGTKDLGIQAQVWYKELAV
jgi:hypothetical protein